MKKNQAFRCFILSLICFPLLQACQSEKKVDEQSTIENQTQKASPKVSLQKVGVSEPLSEINKKNKGKALPPYECEEKFRNENGVCEVPNHPHPEIDEQQ
ncbi:hypothetical protein [Pleionea sp. CnH1-48]|uniref:hypothetical protein n=1 Tax=Pleionea sp. CnH1-48 TaxID=2954494 RepID=UPI0020971AE8|nr:hypothetical protein [Pleionea sp. CnH1-48]MCO7227281.1 hypothetical protein [Pleionea sp. CnH1-48]